MTLSEFFAHSTMTRREFASAVGVDPISVYRWEKGHRLPVRHFAEIARVTARLVTANDFIQQAESA